MQLIAILITLSEAHIDDFFQLAIREGGFDIKMREDQTICSDNGKRRHKESKCTIGGNISS
jgi:hypothetical protein